MPLYSNTLYIVIAISRSSAFSKNVLLISDMWSDVWKWYDICYLEVITEILSFLQIFTVRKTTTHFFLIFQKSAKHLTKKLYSWHALGLPKQITDYRFLWLLTLHCFLLTLITVLFICIIPCIHICFCYFLILCFYFNLENSLNSHQAQVLVLQFYQRFFS